MTNATDTLWQNLLRLLNEVATAKSTDYRADARRAVQRFVSVAGPADLRSLRSKLEDDLARRRSAIVPAAQLNEHSRALAVLEAAVEVVSGSSSGMTLMEQNPHIRNVAISADPRDDDPYGYRITVDTDLDPDTKDKGERQEVEKMVGLLELHLRKNNPGLTGITLRRI